MVLNASDYDARKLVTGGVNPMDPIPTLKLLAGALIALSVAVWAFNVARGQGSNMVNRRMSRLTGGAVSSTSGDNARVL